MAEKIKPKTIVRATTHPGDSRPNIPTAELESFARPEEKRPTIVRYPRDPTFDPQLVAFQEKIEFYRHPGKWANRMILGDSLLVDRVVET